jgi:TolB protein
MSSNSPWPSPDGRSIVYVASDDQACRICVMDRDGRNSRQLTTSDRFDFGPSYSPDGSKIIFARAARHRPAHWGGMTWDQWDIWQVNADGSALRQLTFGRYYSADEPYFNPDGKHVVFGADVGEAFRSSHKLLIFDVGRDGSAVNLREVPLPPQPEKRKYDGDPSFSPDGSRIIFTSLRVSRASPYDYEIWTAGIDGTNLRQITHNSSRNQNPVFSPDGKFIYSTISGLDLYGLWRTRADGSDARRLIEEIPSPKDEGRR